MQDSSKLREARELISDPHRWTQGWMATDRDGYPCHPNSKWASSWCTLGALEKVDATGQDLQDVRDAVPMRWRHKVATYNDVPWHKHRHILRVFDRAIKRREKAYAKYQKQFGTAVELQKGEAVTADSHDQELAA